MEWIFNSFNGVSYLKYCFEFLCVRTESNKDWHVFIHLELYFVQQIWDIRIVIIFLYIYL